MAEGGRTVKIVLRDGETRFFENAFLVDDDEEKKGWIVVYCPKQPPQQGTEPVAGYSRGQVSYWEYEKE